MSAKKSRSRDEQTHEVHLDRHFPDRYPCAGECGIPDCDWVGNCSKDILYYKAMMNPQHKCKTCGNKYDLSSPLDKHIESTHVRLHQVVDFAAEIGYDVGPLGGAAPWMAGVKNEDSSEELPTTVSLAMDAAKAVIRAQRS